VLTWTWLRGLAGRRGGRLAAAAAGTATAVALLACLGSFLAVSQATMTTRSIQRVAVDWQVEGQPGSDPAAILRAVRADPGVAAALPVGYAVTTGLTATQSGSTLTTGAGRVLGLDAQYARTFPAELRYLVGNRDGVLLSQQTAANLHAVPGTQISIGRAGLPPVSVRVDGVVDLPQADSLFQKVGAAAAAQPQAPPDNVLLLPAALWHTVFDPLAGTRPDLVLTQVHVKLDHRLPADPVAAYTQVTVLAHHLEAVLAGTGLVGDNLGAALASARQDALYAQVLFLFLGLPGAVLAALLTAAIAAAGGARRRSEQALLRTRGATTAQLTRLAAVEAAVVGVAGALVGLAVAAAISRLALGAGGLRLDWALGSAALGFVIALATVLVPAHRDARATTVTGARQTVGRRRSPRWLRYGVDVWLLIGSAVVFWATSRNGYQLVLVPEGVPSISVSYWAFVGPALLWLGSALLVWRLINILLRSGRPLLARMLRPLAGRLAPTVAATLSRQRALIGRTLVLVGLTVAFAASTATFDATYRQQAQADAQLTNGADVTVTEPPGSAVSATQAGAIAAVPGVGAVEPVQHRFAYVGADLQDLFGVRPDTIAANTALQDAYFVGGTARQLLGRLAARPDAILVSKETVNDFQLQLGDLLRLRLKDARTGQDVTVPFHYAGIVTEFPTAPKDSFFVANASYIAARTGSDAVAEFLVTTNGAAPPTVADRLRATLGPAAQISDIQTTRTIVGSSLTAVDLAGLTRVELGFALALAAAATGLLLTLGFTERRRTFALARALGARPRQLGGFVWGEVLLVTVGGASFGALLGWLLSEMLVKVLTGVFDPPPSALAVPWPYLGTVVAVTAAATGLAALRAIAVARRPALEVLRDL